MIWEAVVEAMMGEVADMTWIDQFICAAFVSIRFACNFGAIVPFWTQRCLLHIQCTHCMPYGAYVHQMMQ